jgi:hypothetical protein
MLVTTGWRTRMTPHHFPRVRSRLASSRGLGDVSKIERSPEQQEKLGKLWRTLVDTVRSDLQDGGGPGGVPGATRCSVEMWLALTGSTVMHAGIQVAHELWRLWGALAVKRFAFRRCRREAKQQQLERI